MMVYNIKSYMKQLLSPFKMIKHQNAWRKLNSHNDTMINCFVPLDKISVGKGTYGKLNVNNYNSHSSKSKVIIGNYCSIASTVVFFLGGGHELNHFSTFPFKKKYMNIDESLDNGDIVIDDDVWLGENVTIMSGVHIGKGAVIGTGAIVNKDIPPYAIAVGIPAKVIKYRFSQPIINKLMDVDFSSFNSDWIKSHINLLYENIDENNIDEIMRGIYNE